MAALTRVVLRKLFDDAGIPSVYIKEVFAWSGGSTVFVASPFIKEAEDILERNRGFMQDIEVKRLWFWHRWFNEKL